MRKYTRAHEHTRRVTGSPTLNKVNEVHRIPFNCSLEFTCVRSGNGGSR